MKDKIKRFFSLFAALLICEESVPALPPSQSVGNAAPDTSSSKRDERISNKYSPDGMSIQLSISKMKVSEQRQRQLDALALLAKNIIDNPSAAQAFKSDPHAYLDKMGFEGVVLSLNSNEVKVVMALSEPAIRDAVKKNDYDKFLSELEKRGLLKQPEATTRCSPAAAVCVAYFVAVAASDAVVAVNVVATVSVVYKLAVYTSVAVKTTGPKERAETRAGGMPMTTVAQALGGPEFADKALDYCVNTYADKIASSIEKNTSPEQLGKLNGERLRDMLSKQIFLHLNSR